MNWFKLALVIFFVITQSNTFAGCQEFSKEDRFGKSVDDVLRMNPDEWSDWYTDSSRGGSSTAGMSGAERIYADCLDVKIQRLIMLNSPSFKSEFEEIDKLLRQIEYGCLDAGRAFTGGGTMWLPIGARADVKRKTAQLDAISKKSPKKSINQSDVWSAYREADSQLLKNKSDIDDMKTDAEGGYESAKQSLGSARQGFAALLTKIGKMPSAFRSHYLAFSRDMFRLVRLG